jgi:hemerythrin
MLGTHIVNDPAIDTQHEVIFSHLDHLQKMLLDEEQEQPIQLALQDLREMLLVHFGREESFMDEHRRQHRNVLDLLEQCLGSVRPNGETGPPLREAVSRLADALLHHELRNADIGW